jgi:release factor glutamine methyltransferase
VVLVDLCCGCGAVGGAVLLGLRADGGARGNVTLHAADVEPAAVEHARRNLAPLGGTAHRGDLFAALPAELRGRVGVLTCNAPYVPTEAIATMPPEAREHEPAVALAGGGDGLDVLRRVVAGAPSWLAPGGSLLFEVSTGQVPAATALVRGHGLRPRVVTDDPDADDATGGTVVVATR